MSFESFEALIDLNRESECLDLAQFTYVSNDPQCMNKCENFEYLNNRTLNLSYEQSDLFLGLIKYYADVLERNIVLKIRENLVGQVAVQFIINDEVDYINRSIEYFDNKYDSTEEMLKEIKSAIDQDRPHEFTTLEDLTTYTFKDNGEEGIEGSFYKLKCGHFLGLELVKDFFLKLDHKCHLCRKLVGIDRHFKSTVYKIEDNN